MKKNIGVFIDHDLMIRHFIKENKFKELEKKYNLIYFFSKNKKRIIQDINRLKIKNKIIKLDVDLRRKTKNTLLSYVGRINNAYRKKKLSFKNAAIQEVKVILNSRLLFYSYLIFANKFIYPFYKWFCKKFTIKFNEYLNNEVKKNELSFIIHPTVLNGDFVQDLVEIGKYNNIPTFLIMNSWDNCTSRAFTHGNPTKYLVWGESIKKMASENLNLPKKNIDVIGCAQFDIYKQNPSISRKRYRKKIGVKKNEFLVCYAGSNIGINETKHLKIIDKQISLSKLKVKILYRPHPWKKIHKNEISFFENKFQNIKMDYFSKKRYKNIFLKKPKKLSIGTINYDQTNTIIKSIDAAILPPSTFSVECALNEVPISIYLPILKDEISPRVIIEADYFKYLSNFLKPIICKGEKNLFKTINKLSKFASYKKNKIDFQYRAQKLISFKKKETFEKRLFDYIKNFEINNQLNY